MEAEFLEGGVGVEIGVVLGSHIPLIRCVVGDVACGDFKPGIPICKKSGFHDAGRAGIPHIKRERAKREKKEEEPSHVEGVYCKGRFLLSF